MKRLITLLLTGIALQLSAQTTEPSSLPYRQIPDAPADYGAGNVVVRMIDGLGFRYYWATEGLTQADLDYRPSEDGRTARETLEHIFNLTSVVVHTAGGRPSPRAGDLSGVSFPDLRRSTLLNLLEASREMAGKTPEELEKLDLIFDLGEQQPTFAFWYLLNGPLADAIYHTGQIVVFRRASGNPVPEGVSVFRGTGPAEKPDGQ